MTFESLGLPEPVLRAVVDAGYDAPTTVQAAAIPPAIAGHDLMVAAATGSGKTASFILPALHRILAARADLSKKREKGAVYGPRVLVLTPTRELAIQIAKAADVYGRHVPGLRVATVVGGVPYGAQLKALRGPLDILISTPGRLLDHLQSGKAVIGNVEMFVLDEADRMLDMGFIDDIRTIADHVPATRQTVMYSATFLGNVGGLARSLLRDPQKVEVASHTDTHANIEQRLHWADNGAHKNALLDHILTQREIEQALVFTSTQRDADWLADRLAGMGHSAAALHGGMPQGRRNRVLQDLRTGRLKVLVATDVAARGIDVRTISHVVNYGLPMKPEDYVHRIGRTGRAGKNGLAVTLAERMDAGMIRRIQQFTTQPIPVTVIAGFEPKTPAPKVYAAARVAALPDRSFDRAPRRDEPRRPFDRRADAPRPFEHRHAGSPVEHRHGDAPARPAAARNNPFDRALPPRDDRGAPARRPGPSTFKARGKPPARPRPGGFVR